MSSDLADGILERFAQIDDDVARKALADAVVDEFVVQMRSGSDPDLGPVLVAIERLATRADVWELLRPAAGPRLCRILSRPAVLALASSSSLPPLLDRLSTWMSQLLFERNHIQNALKAIESYQVGATSTARHRAATTKTTTTTRPTEFCFESARHEQKRRRFISTLRPKDEPDDAEFSEVWERVCKWDGRIPHRGTVDFGLGCDVYRCDVVDNAYDLSVKHTICIWDLDETLILFNCLLDRTRYRSRFSWTASNEVAVMGESLCAHILSIADDVFFFSQIEEFDQDHIDALVGHDDLALLDGYDFGSVVGGDGAVSLRLLSYRFRAMRSRYVRSLAELVPPETERLVAAALDEIDRLSGGWLTTARRVLQESFASSGCTNVVVSAGQLTPTFVKLIVFGLSGLFPIDNIYSSRNSSKAALFGQILERFGPYCTYRVLGDSFEEELAASKVFSSKATYTFIPVRSIDDLIALAQPLPQTKP